VDQTVDQIWSGSAEPRFDRRGETRPNTSKFNSRQLRFML